MTDAMAYTIHLERRAEREFRRLPREAIRRIDAMLRQQGNRIINDNFTGF